MATVYNSFGRANNVKPGVAPFALIIPIEDIETWGSVTAPAAGDTFGKLVEITTKHTPKTGKKWIRLEGAPKKNKHSYESTGEEGFMYFAQKGEFVFPGSDVERHGFASYFNNRQVAVLLKDSKCAENMYYQYGDECGGPVLKFNFDTGSGKEGLKGMTISVEFETDTPYIYRPALADKPEVYDTIEEATP